MTESMPKHQNGITDLSWAHSSWKARRIQDRSGSLGLTDLHLRPVVDVTPFLISGDDTAGEHWAGLTGAFTERHLCATAAKVRRARRIVGAQFTTDRGTPQGWRPARVRRRPLTAARGEHLPGWHACPLTDERLRLAPVIDQILHVRLTESVRWR